MIPQALTFFARSVLALGFVLVVATALHAAEPNNLLPNPGFEMGATNASGWRTRGVTGATLARDAQMRHGGAAAARIVSPKGTRATYPAFSHVVKFVLPGEEYEAEVLVRTQGSKDGVGAYIALEMMHNGRRVGISQSRTTREQKDGGWVRLSAEATIPGEATELHMHLILNGKGTAWFDNAKLVRTRSVDAGELGKVEIDNRPGKAASDWWATLAAEYDPIQFMRESTAPNLGRRGMNESWWTVERERVRKMGLHGMRLWFQVGWWEPVNDNADPAHYKPDFSGFDVDGPRMRSVWRFFEMCRDYDVEVQLNFGWKFRHPVRHWLCRSLTGRPHIKSAAEHAESLVALLRYTREVKKLPVITHVSLGNEFEYNYPEMHPAIHARLVKEKLRDRYVLVGLEDNRRPDHRPTIQFVARHPKALDVLSLHRYGTNNLGKWVSQMERAIAGLKKKDFTPARFGSRGRIFFSEFPLGHGRGGGDPAFVARAVATSAHAAAYAIGGWRLSDQHLPNAGPKAHGRDLFNHGLHQWGTWPWIPWMQKPRDSWYAASLLTRYTRRRSKIFLPKNARPGSADVVCFEKDGDWTVLVVNGWPRPKPVEIRLTKAPGKPLHRHVCARGAMPKGLYDTVIPSDRSFKEAVIKDKLPPQSFALYTTFADWPQAEVAPYVSTAKPGETIPFKVRPVSYKGAFRWSVDGGKANGTITQDGAYTAPKGMPAIDPVIVRATGVEDDRCVGLGVISFSGQPTSAPDRPHVVLQKQDGVAIKGRRLLDIGQAVPVGPSRTVSFRVTNHGPGRCEFTTSASVPWLDANPKKATVASKTEATVTVEVKTAGLERGRYYLGTVFLDVSRGLGRDAVDVFLKTAD